MNYISETENIRIDKYLTEKTGLTRNQLAKLINNKKVLVNGNPTKASYSLKVGDEIEVFDDTTIDTDITAENIPLDIVYEDEYLLVVNKPSGMVVHPANGNYHHTLVNALMHHCNKLSDINGSIRPGIVHRIDADTSGLLLVAKTNQVHNDLAKQISEKIVNRKYVALVQGVISEDRATIDAPIGRDSKNRKKMCITSENSKDAVTHFKVLERYKNTTLIECVLETGRTHQIRAHMEYINHPIVNDPVYGFKKLDDETFGQMLHAKEIGFVHPITKEFLNFSKEPPQRFMEILTDYQNKE